MDTPDKTPRKRLITRRRAIASILTGTFAGAGMIGWAIGVEPHWIDTQSHDIRLRRLPAHWQGKRVVQLSDFHTGEVDRDHLIHACKRVNELNPDLIALTGDFIDHGHTEQELISILSTLKTPSMGIVACLGNHDYGMGWRNVDLANRVAQTVSSTGIRMLRDDLIDIEGLQLVGLDDFWSPRFEARSILSQIDPTRDAICLCHNPDVCDEPVWSAFQGMILSGHTHGGQCKPPFLPPPMLPVKNRRYVAGFYEIAPGRSLYINRGIGHTLQARFNCRPEITVLNLHKAA